MCGRYARFSSLREFSRLAGLVPEAPEAPAAPAWNIAPGLACTVVRRAAGQAPRLDELTWGLIPHWARQRPAARPINARLETAAGKQMYKRLIRNRRCLVAADGWYGWLPTPQGKQPFFLRFAAPQPCFFGGLWNDWTSPAGDVISTFTILTQPAAQEIAHVHQRMPVIVAPAHYAAWLAADIAEADEVQALCQPPSAGTLLAYRVDTALNRTDARGPALIERLE